MSAPDACGLASAAGPGHGVLPPFPEGWYFVASRKAVRKAALIERIWMGRRIVAWCGSTGPVAVAESVCPHLGSDLGPAAGGRVRDGCLVCPFHGYEFDVAGRCVATPYAPPPRATKLNRFETRELGGMVFAWWGIEGRPPQWSLPEDPVVGADWTELGFRTLRFPGHPQETTENSVDLGHLRYVHGYDSVKRTEPVTVDGAHLTSHFDFRRTQRVAGIARVEFDVSVETDIFGLGYSLVKIRELSVGMDILFWVLATPVDGKLVDFVLASRTRELRRPRRPVVGLRFLPVRLRSRLMNQIILSLQRTDVLQDVTIWSRKRYRRRPRLCASDGEIGIYRRYCRQFYAENQRTSLPAA